MRLGACISIALVLNLSIWDFCVALSGSTEKPDSLDAQTPPGAVSTPDSSALEITPPTIETKAIRLYDGDLSDNEGDTNQAAPVYRKWWFWSIIGGALVTAAIIGAGGGEEARPDLPDFPGPPER
jgi:hypothetical protein